MRGFDVLYDDREPSPGEKFVEAELLGCPLRVVAGSAASRAASSRCRCGAGREERTRAARLGASGARELWNELA